MKKSKKFLQIIGWFFTVLLTLIGVGSAFKIFLIDGIATSVVLTVPHYWLPLVVGLFIIWTVLWFKNRQNKARFIGMVLSVITLIASTSSIMGMTTALNDAGAKVSFFKSYQLENVSEVKVDTQVYTTSEYGDVALNVYQVADGKTDKPVIIYIHGGGWISGDKDNATYYSKVFAAKGYVVISVDYDLSSEERHLYQTTELQITHAFAWVEQNIAKYGGNTKNLFVTGDSAGGNLALEMAYKINNNIYQTVNGVILSKVDAVSVVYPVSSPKSFYENNDILMGNMAKNMAKSYVGVTPTDNPQAYASITPMNYISQSTPPTLMISGTRDTLVPQEATYELAQALAENGVSHQLVKVPNANHGFELIPGSIGNQAFINLTLQWFGQIQE